MTSTFVEHKKAQLEEEQSRLRGQIARLTGSADESSNTAPQWAEMGQKEDENAAEVTTYEERLSLRKNLEKTLDEVVAALAKIAEGSYGVCVKCGKAIDEKRLEAFPAATQHTDCSTVSA